MPIVPRHPLLLLALLLAAPAPARAQGAAEGGGLSASLSVRTRLEGWRWFETPADDEYLYSGTLVRGGVARQRERFGWQVELAAPLLLGLPEEASAPAPQGQSGLGPAYYAANDGEENVATVFLKQAYLRFGAAPGRPGQGVRLGRMEFVEGAEVMPPSAALAAVKRDRVAHRLLGNFGWSHAGRSLDAAHYAYTERNLHASALVGRPTQGVFDADGWPELQIGVVYTSLTLQQPNERAPGEGRLFLLHYLDYRDEPGLVKTDNRPLPARRADDERVSVTTLGGHYLRALPTAAGPVDLMLWGAYQAGSWGVQDHRAWAAAGEVGVQPPVLPALRPWLRAGWSRGSGDGDPADGRHRTFFQVLPTPRIYARLPFYNLMNTQEVFGSLILRPSARLGLRADLRSLRLAAAEDLWYAGGGAFEPESFGFAGRPSGGAESLATLADVGAELRLGSRVTASAYFGWAAGGGVVERLYPAGDDARFAFLELEYRR